MDEMMKKEPMPNEAREAFGLKPTPEKMYDFRPVLDREEYERMKPMLDKRQLKHSFNAPYNNKTGFLETRGNARQLGELWSEFHPEENWELEKLISELENSADKPMSFIHSVKEEE